MEHKWKPEDSADALISSVPYMENDIKQRNTKVKNGLESTAKILLSDTNEDERVEAIRKLGELEVENSNHLESEVKLLTSVYSRELSPKVRIAIIEELYVSSFKNTTSELALDTIVNAAKFDYSDSVKQYAISMLREFKEEGLIADSLKDSNKPLTKKRIRQLVKEMKEMGI